MEVLRDRVALVTGASKGIGAAIAKRLGREGIFVYVNYCSDPVGAQSVVNEIADSGGEAAALGGNVSVYEDIQNMYQRIRADGRSLDILVNCAGISPVNHFHRYSREDVERIILTNLMGTIFCSQEALQTMKDSGGYIVNISSIHGTRAGVGRAVYAASKGGIDGLTRALAAEYGEKVHINSLIVGSISTERTDAVELVWDERPFIPCKRFGKPEEVANLVFFLVSGQADFINGANIAIDGGASSAHVECGQQFTVQEFVN